MGMTREQFATLVKAMKAVYTDPKFIPDQYAFDLWYAMLKDLEYSLASSAVQKHIVSSRYAPSISDIREHYVDITDTQPLNEMEAWGLVSKALRNGYYGAEEEFEKLPKDVQDAVGTPKNLRNWSQTDEESVENVIQSNFLRTYRAVLQRKAKRCVLPRSLMEKIDSKKFCKIQKIEDEKSQTD